jgi:hypothetical protein
MTTIPASAPSGPVHRRMGPMVGWGIMTALAVLVAGYALSAVFFPDARSSFVGELYARTPLAAYAHMAGGGIALLLGPFQLNARIRSRWLSIHRVTGRVYLGAILVGGIAALILALRSTGGLVTHIGFGMLGVLWLASTIMAYLRIRTGDQVAHRRWMIRSYALTLAAVTLRIYLPLSLASGIPFVEAYQAIAWFCWVPNLVVAEWFILTSTSTRRRNTSATALP